MCNLASKAERCPLVMSGHPGKCFAHRMALLYLVFQSIRYRCRYTFRDISQYHFNGPHWKYSIAILQFADCCPCSLGCCWLQRQHEQCTHRAIDLAWTRLDFPWLTETLLIALKHLKTLASTRWNSTLKASFYTIRIVLFQGHTKTRSFVCFVVAPRCQAWKRGGPLKLKGPLQLWPLQSGKKHRKRIQIRAAQGAK